MSNQTEAIAKKPALIVDAEKMSVQMSVQMAAYWNKVAATKKVDVVDPWRKDLKVLRAIFPAGTRVYRASTGGKWGKSATIATL